MVRLEDVDGQAVRNNYRIKHFRHGPPAPKQSAAAWESDLKSTDRMRVLRALVWLGGTHWDLKENPVPDRQGEDREDVLLVREVRQREKVIARLRELVESNDRWVREAAKLDLHPKDR